MSTNNNMEPIFNILPLNFQPQQKEYLFEEDNLKFTSKFDSGNMLKAERHLNSSTFFIQIASDCYGTQQEYSYKTWFFFSVKNYNSHNKKIRICIVNMQNQSKLFWDGYKFVYRIADLNYDIDEDYKEDEEFSWRRFPNDIKSEKFLEYLEKENNLFNDEIISYSRDLLTFSKEKRRLDIITITSNEANSVNTNFTSNNYNIIKNNNNNYQSSANHSKTAHLNNIHNSQNKPTLSNFTKISSEPIINPYTPKSANIKYNRNSNLYSNINGNNNNNFFIHSTNKSMKIPDKSIVFISARVHPGETPSSFLMNGLLRFLLNKKDPRAEILRKAFVFKIIPIINVDGVSRGFYRYDTNSLNMNRHYISPGMKTQPEIYAIKKLFLHFSQQGKIKYYFDLHAHASSRGLFLFGNSLDFLQQIENKLLPKLIELNSEDLIYTNCNFSEKSMRSKDKGDKYSKEGTGRVHFNKICDIIHCYTVEASYYRGVQKNKLTDIKPINFNLLIDKEILKTENFNFDFNSQSILNAINPINQIDSQNRMENIESEHLLQILAKYFKIDIENSFFSDQEVMKKAFIKKSNDIDNKNKNLTKNKDFKLDEDEKIRHINLNINLSFDSLNKSKDKMTINNNSSIDSSMYSLKLEQKNESNTIDTFNIDKKKIPKLSEHEKDVRSDFEFLQEQKNTIEKYTEDEIINKKRDNKPKFNSISNFNQGLNLNQFNNSFINKHTNDQSLIVIKENLHYEKLKPKTSKILTRNEDQKAKNKSLCLNKNTVPCNENKKQEIIKQIENFDNIDYDIYKTLVFFDERYLLVANSFKNPNSLHFSKCLKEENFFHTPISYEKMGISMLIAILDYEKLNPFSRLANTEYKSIENLRTSVAQQIFQGEEKYKSSAFCQNYIKNLNSVKKFESLNEKIIEKLKNRKISKRSNSMSMRKLNNAYNNNIIINNFNNNYFGLISSGNNSHNGNFDSNHFITDSRKMFYNINVGDSLMSHININNYNVNVCNYSNSDNNLFYDNKFNTIQGNLDKNSIDNCLRNNIADLINFNRPNFFNNDGNSSNNLPSKFNSLYYSNFLSNNYINQESKFSTLINQSNPDKNNKNLFNLNEINNHLNPVKVLKNDSSINYDAKKRKQEYALDIPKRLKFQMDLLKNKAERNKTIKTNNESEQIDIDSEFLNKEDQIEILRNYINFSKSPNSNNIYMSHKPSNENFSGNPNQLYYLNNITKREGAFKETKENRKAFINNEKIGSIMPNNFQTTKNKKMHQLISQDYSKYRNIKSETRNNLNEEKIILTGSHAAKIRMLKGLDSKGNKKKSESILNVKCVGLKADFNLNDNPNSFKFSKNEIKDEKIKFSSNSVLNRGKISINNGGENYPKHK